MCKIPFHCHYKHFQTVQGMDDRGLHNILHSTLAPVMKAKQLYLHPLSPKSDQCQFSPHKINP